MTTASQVISTARSQIGVVESPFGSNRQKYGAWYGWNGVPWCDQFISWCFAQRGAVGLIGGKSASVALTAQRMRNKGRYGSMPRVGALAIFNNYTHIELVTSISSYYTVNCIGGNTSSSTGSISNGGGVWAKTRNRSLIRGYGYPAYSTVTPVPAPPVITKPEVDMPLTDGEIAEIATEVWTRFKIHGPGGELVPLSDTLARTLASQARIEAVLAKLLAKP